MTRWICSFLLLAAAACGGGATYSVEPVYPREPAYANDNSVRDEIFRASVHNAESTPAPAPSAALASAEYAPAPSSDSFEIAGEEATGEASSGAALGRATARYADATPQAVQPVAGTQRAAAGDSARIVDDAQHGPLLIYTATIHLSVFEVERTQASIVEAVRAVGGFVQLQNDRQLTIRVPAAEFRTVLPQIEQLGDVLHRNVEALDVSEEFRDLGVRLQNALAVRDRLQLLLAQATNTEQALNVERELERVALVVEQIRGRMQLLGDRIAYSTVTVMFQAHAVVTDHPGAFRLPVPWLDELTLSRLLTLPSEE